MLYRNDISADFLRSILKYVPKTGVFIWKYRVNDRSGWNTRNVGNIAGVKDNGGYIIISIKHKPYKAHRLAWLYMTGQWPEKEIDHKDLCKNNNKWQNLRESTSLQNKYNRRKSIINTSGYKGVHFTKRGKWRAAISINYKIINLGEFSTKEEAYVTYCAAIKYRGEFARAA